MKEIIKKFIKETPNSVLFWNAMYYVVLIASAFYDIDLMIFLYGISSLFAIAIMIDKDGDMENHLWITTSIPVLFIFVVFGIGFAIGYPLYKFVFWINNKLDGKKKN